MTDAKQKVKDSTEAGPVQPNRDSRDEARTKEDNIASFQNLGICRELAEAAVGLGWKQPSNIQEQAVPLVLQGMEHHNLVLRASKNVHGHQKQWFLMSIICICRTRCHWAGADWFR